MQWGLVIVAAGKGERLGASCHKALVPVDGVPLLLRCARLFSRIPTLKELVLVVHRDDIGELEDGILGEHLHECGAWKLVIGGARRQDSVLNGVRALDESTDAVLVHDAARPFVSAATIDGLVAAVEEAAGAVPVVPMTSTVKRLGDAGRVIETVPRADLALAQTPQAARRALLEEALEQADAQGLEVTDDVAALELLGHEVRAVPDSRWNFKVTTPDDLALAHLVARENLWQESER